jgi:molybdenum cofactor cytidylyltransferase
MTSIAAIILAAGSSRRMGKAFKPLLPLGDSTVMEYVMETYRKAQIKDIRVVCGFRAEDVRRICKNPNISIIENRSYASGMFSSVKLGIQSLNHEIDGFFIHPVDIPLVRPSTVKTLVSFFKNGLEDVYYPAFNGIKGHPPLIRTRLARQIIAWDGQGGLQGALSDINAPATTIPVCDQGILEDMDTEKEYLRMVHRRLDLDIPTRKECKNLMDKVFCICDDIRNHGLAVSQTTLLIAEKFPPEHQLNRNLILASALLHDATRGEKNHAQIAAGLLRDAGFDRVADIVAAHMDYPVGEPVRLDEKALVFLGDKLIEEDHPVSMVGRFEKKARLFAGNPEAVEAIYRRRDRAMRVKQAVESAINMSVEDLIECNQHLYENEISIDDLFDASW